MPRLRSTAVWFTQRQVATLLIVTLLTSACASPIKATVSTVALRALVENGVAAVGKSLAPDEDWMPTLFCVDANGAFSVVEVGGYADGRQRDAAIVKVAREHKAVSVGFVSTAWFSKSPVGSTMLIRSSRGRGRLESVLITVIRKGGSALSSMAEIVRSPKKPPTLLPWRRTNGGECALVDALRKAVT